MLESQKSKIILGNYKIKEGLLNLISDKSNKPLKLYKKFLNDNFKILKRIKTTTARSKIEFDIEKRTSNSAFDWQQEIVAVNNIFAMMVGIIDARILDNDLRIDFLRKFKDAKDIEQIQSDQSKLYEYRNKIIQDYNDICERKDNEVIMETLEAAPSHMNFNNLFEDMKENHYQLSIQGQFISAYMFGFNKSLYIFPEEIVPYYNEIISKYKLEDINNNHSCQKVKNYLERNSK